MPDLEMASLMSVISIRVQTQQRLCFVVICAQGLNPSFAVMLRTQKAHTNTNTPCPEEHFLVTPYL